jgi:hypothetical protein
VIFNTIVGPCLIFIITFQAFVEQFEPICYQLRHAMHTLASLPIKSTKDEKMKAIKHFGI